MSSRVLVTDGEHRAALAVVRSLGRAGHTVYVSASRTGAIAAASRYCRDFARIPDPLTAGPACVEELRRLCRQWQIDVLLPITEASIIALRPQSESLSGVLVPFSSYEAFCAISDKANLMRIAPGFGLAVPQQIELSAAVDRRELDVSQLHFPLVIKPSRSVAGNDSGRMSFQVAYANDTAELHTQLDQLPESAYPVLLQQRVIGRGMGIMVLLWDDAPKAVFAHRRLREKPPSGGVSVYSESIAADPALVARVIELLREHRWAGVAMAEFKVETSTGIPWLMEINGRFWGSLQLAIDAGVDFPRLLVELATENSGVSAAQAKSNSMTCDGHGYRAGTRLRWWWGDVDQLLIRLLKRRADLHLPESFPGRVRALREFSHAWRRADRSEVLRWSDPVPGLIETYNWLRRR